MAEATPYNMDAVRADGFVDFYELLSVSTTAGESELRDRIQSLYSEAQANRDHRNLNKRRDYQGLLEYLPQARTALLDPAKRALYDDYAGQAAGGGAPTNFAAFMGQLSGQVAGENSSDVLGVQDAGRAGRAQTGSSRTSGSGTAGNSTGASASTGASSGARRQPQVAPSAQAGLMASAMSVIVFAVLTLAVGLLMKSWPAAILIGAVAAVAVWFLARPKGNTPVGR